MISVREAKAVNGGMPEVGAIPALVCFCRTMSTQHSAPTEATDLIAGNPGHLSLWRQHNVNTFHMP